MRHSQHLSLIYAARTAILACDVTGHVSPHGRQICMESLRQVWRTHDTLYFNLALYLLREEGLIRILAVDRLYLVDAKPAPGLSHRPVR